MSDEKRLAVLFDADNIPAKMAGRILDEISTLGKAFVKRAYGDWTSPVLAPWREVLNNNAIIPSQQFAYTSGKNATDVSMVIDAMDLLYSSNFDGFCLVSSDSDFTRLAARIRQNGLVVYGFGGRQTPRALMAACDKFTYIENIKGPDMESTNPASPSSAQISAPVASTAPSAPATSAKSPHGNPSLTGASATPSFSQIVRLVMAAINNCNDYEGWANLANLGTLLIKWQPDFDPRTYGHERLRHLLEHIRGLELKSMYPVEGKPPVVYVRVKKQQSHEHGGLTLQADVRS